MSDRHEPDAVAERCARRNAGDRHSLLKPDVWQTRQQRRRALFARFVRIGWRVFPHGEVQARRITLAPPIARAVIRLHPSLYTLFNTVPALRTHVLAWIVKP